VQTVAAGEAPLAIRGYDAVAYFNDGRPRHGLAEIEYEWDQQRYRFATADHRELFRANPTRYAPQFANFCAMSLSKGELVVADPEIWLINDDRLYLFGKPEGPELFRQNLSGNTRDAGENALLLLKKR
jgi:YHS domain-containing protein